MHQIVVIYHFIARYKVLKTYLKRFEYEYNGSDPVRPLGILGCPGVLQERDLIKCLIKYMSIHASEANILKSLVTIFKKT